MTYGSGRNTIANADSSSTEMDGRISRELLVPRQSSELWDLEHFYIEGAE